MDGVLPSVAEVGVSVSELFVGPVFVGGGFAEFFEFEAFSVCEWSGGFDVMLEGGDFLFEVDDVRVFVPGVFEFGLEVGDLRSK